MINDIFAEMPEKYQTGKVDTKTVYYFSIDDTKKTLTLEPDRCTVEDGKAVDNADCVCKTSEEFFLKVWNEGYTPGLGDFLSGKIKSNNPDALKTFIGAFR